jgi:hypothetical protein
VWQGQKQIHERLPNWKNVALALQRTIGLCDVVEFEKLLLVTTDD